MTRIVAIDQGTTSTRAVVVQDGVVRLAHSVAHRQSYPRQGWVEQDAEELIANVEACLDAAGPCDSLALANQGESCLAWDAETARPISPVIVWQDARTQGAVDKLAAAGAGDFVKDRAGLPLDAYFSASKLSWLLNNIEGASDLLRQGRLRLGTTDAFYIQRLTGNCFTDVSTAARTSLMQLRAGTWDEQLCDLFKVPLEAMPEIRPSVGEFGKVRRGGFSAPLSASVVDQAASLYGHGCRRRGDAKITFGTGAFALALTGEAPADPGATGLVSTAVWRIGKETAYALDGGVYNASSAVDWARSLGLFSEFSEIDRFEAAPAISRDLAFVPALSGLACPHWDRRAGGMWLGLSLDTTRRDMMQAVLEGIAFRAAEVVEAIDGIVSVAAPVSIDGGMATNVYFRQFLANALNRAVRVPRFAELTAVGAAQLAGAEVAPDMAASLTEPTTRDGEALRRRFAEALSRAKLWKSVPEG